MTEIVMYDPRITALAQEVNAHPKLLARVKLAQDEGAKAHSIIFTGKAGDADIPIIQGFEQAIGFLAAEVGILLDGIYNYEAICDICDRIRQRLEEKRLVIVNTPDSQEPHTPSIIIPPYMH
jgi:NaMN:DMB phosphoribosyltransferase